MNRIYVLILLCCATVMTHAQDNRPLLSDVEAERLLIEAKQLFVLEDFDKASTKYKTLIKENDQNAFLYYELARCQMQLDNPSDAVKNAEKAYNLENTSKDYSQLLAELYVQTFNYSGASKVFESLIKKDPYNFDAYLNLAYCYLKSNKPEKAIATYDALESMDGMNVEYTIRKFNIYKIQKKSSKAIQELERFLSIEPNDLDVLHTLAEYYKELGEKNKSNEVYEQILLVDPNDQIAHLVKAENAFDKGDRNAYLSSINELFKNPSIEIDLKIKEILPFMNDLAVTKDAEFMDQMKNLGNTIVAVHPNDAKSYSLMGDILYYSGDSEGALGYYDKTLALNNSILSVWENKLYILSDLKKFETLEKSSNEAIDLFPNQPIVYFLNGLALSSQKKYALSVKSLEEALIRSKFKVELKNNILLQLANDYNSLGSFDASDKYFNELLTINPDNVTALNNYSYYLSQRNDKLDIAQSMALKANQLHPNEPMFQDTYGWVLFKSGNYNEAKIWLEKSISNGGDKYGEVLEHYGDILYKLGDKDAAVNFWIKASDKEGVSDKIQEKIKSKSILD